MAGWVKKKQYRPKTKQKMKTSAKLRFHCFIFISLPLLRAYLPSLYVCLHSFVHTYNYGQINFLDSCCIIAVSWTERKLSGRNFLFFLFPKKQDFSCIRLSSLHSLELFTLYQQWLRQTESRIKNSRGWIEL